MFSEGRFEQALILTFGADLEFYERVLRRHFGSFRNQIVLADGNQLDRTVAGLAESGSLRHLNRSWLAGPIRIPHSAHAKAILLAGPESGALLVGSGNLNISGYAGAGECFTPYRWTPDEPEDLSAFTSIRELTEGLEANGSLDEVTRERLATFWSAYDWWHAPGAAGGTVRDNLVTPLGDQFVTAVAGEAVQQLTVMTPFHDPKCAALDTLAKRLKPRNLRVLVQPGNCSVDPTRLATVLKSHQGEARSVVAAGDYGSTYLHAKIVLAVTKHRAVCLTGSANCSMVALWAQQPHANIELGNLAIGPPDAFEYLFDRESITIGAPADPSTLDVDIHDDDDNAPDDQSLRIQDLRYNPPVLSGLISATVTTPDDVTVEVRGSVVPAVIALQVVPDRSDWTHFSATLLETSDIEAMEHVAVVTLRIGDEACAATVPYQVERLREQDKHRVDADRLRHAARLELDDPDLEQALAALEEILIGDNVARWTHGQSPGVDVAGEASIAWEAIDWSAVRRHPRYAAYGGPGGLGAVAGSDLAAYLDALSQAVRELAEPEQAPPPAFTPGITDLEEGDDDDVEDVELSGGVEGAEVDDVIDEPDDDPGPQRRQSLASRNLRLIRNFVRRNLKALEQPAFRDGAGPGIVIPNAIILNWLCWWVATKDEDRPGELMEERLRLWRVLWGDTAGADGYLGSLDDEHEELVLDRFDQQLFEGVSVASMIDVWSHTSSDNDASFQQLRSVLRRAVCEPCWQVSAAHLVQAANLINGRPTTPEALDPTDVAETLWDAACRTVGDRDIRSAVSAVVGVPIEHVRLGEQSVRVDESNVTRAVAEVTVETDQLDVAGVTRAFAAWLGVNDRDYYRLRWAGGVALYRAVEENGWVYTETDDEMTELQAIDADAPPWRVELDRLYEAAEAAAKQAA